MLLRRLVRKNSGRFNYDLGFSFAAVTAGLATVVHVIWLAASLVSFRRRLDAATMVIVDWDSSMVMMHIRIGVALVLGLVGLFSRRLIGLAFSAVAFIWISFEYVAWFLWSVRIKADADIETLPASVPHALNLYGATPWNVMVLVLVIAVLVWLIGRVIKSVKSEGDQWLEGGEIGG